MTYDEVKDLSRRKWHSQTELNVYVCIGSSVYIGTRGYIVNQWKASDSTTSIDFVSHFLFYFLLFQ